MLVTLRSWKFESSSGHQFKFKVMTLSFPKTRESGFLRFWHLKTKHSPVGAAEGCDLLLLKKAKSKDRSLRQLLQGQRNPSYQSRRRPARRT
ncbi:hypothetical protein EMIT0215P_130057 [Pseudomonas serboccidentalis]